MGLILCQEPKIHVWIRRSFSCEEPQTVDDGGNGHISNEF